MTGDAEIPGILGAFIPRGPGEVESQKTAEQDAPSTEIRLESHGILASKDPEPEAFWKPFRERSRVTSKPLRYASSHGMD